MSICQKAADILHQRGDTLTSEQVATLASYDEKTQIRFATNPAMESMLQHFTDQIINNIRQAKPVPTPAALPNRCVCGAIVHDDDDDDDNLGYGLFD